MGSRTPQDVLYADIQKQSAYVEALKARVNLEQNLILLESLTGHLSIETLLAISKRVIQ
jgi:outer membrane protein TolC